MNYPSIRIEGAILSPDIFDRLDDAAGQQPADFGLEPSAKVKDEIARAWADAQDYWRIFQRKLESLKAESPATTETRNNWIVPLLGLLGYQLEYQARGTELNGKNYPLSHRITNKAQTPVHIVGYHEPSGLDRKPEKSALRMSAHALVQEYLNLTDQLYALATNGRVLRLLRDSSRLVKLSYLEFDLDRIFSDGLFADFAMLYRLLHASRLPQSADAASSCWLERYHQDTIEQGTRIREGLRAAVTEALELLGTGFIAHPDNTALREQITAGQLAPEDFFKHILRLVYRQLFLMVIEERGLVFPKGTPTKTINIYFQHYSVQRLRRLAVTRGLKIERFHDAWLSLLATFRLFEQQETAAKLGMSALGGKLFHPEALGPLTGCRLSNASLFTALDRLCNFNHPKTGQRMPVNFGALATEEFGSVYESLLELHPIVEAGASPRFGFKQAAGNERKTSGSYYTPTSLVDCLLDSALDPVLDERIRDFAKLGYPSAEAAILAMKVCDPACGSGHFLIAAAQRIARRLAKVRSGDDEPSPQVMRHALRDVISHCIYGVDINPMAVELCKVALWMEAMEPGKPLSFLDHHIQCGNSLLGTTPALLEKGIPDDAFAPIEGDVKEFCAALKRDNKNQREEFERGQTGFAFEKAIPAAHLGELMMQIDAEPDDTVERLERKQQRAKEFFANEVWQSARFWADYWCSSFVWQKDRTDLSRHCPTERDFRRVEQDGCGCLLPHVRAEVERLRDQYQFFHWHIAFPDVFLVQRNDDKPENRQTGWSGGFDVILGNPPWVRQEALGTTKKLLGNSLAFSSTADLSVFFTQLALDILRRNHPLALLTPNKWLKTNYGNALRNQVRTHAKLDLLIDFGHSRTLFPDADTFPAAVVMRPTEATLPETTTFRFLDAPDKTRESFGLTQLLRTEAFDIPFSQLDSTGWRLENPEINKLFTKIASTGRQLSAVLTSPIRRGVTTGFNQAFVIDAATRESLVAAEPRAVEVIKPWLRGADIKRWTTIGSGLYLIFTRRGIDIAQYPAIEDFLSKWRAELTPKTLSSDDGIGRKPGPYAWYEIQDNTAYYRDFERPKLVVPSILYYCEFAFVPAIAYPSNKVNIIPTDDLGLLSLLNSRTSWWFMSRHFIKMKDDALSVDVNTLAELPIPDAPAHLWDRLREIGHELSTREFNSTLPDDSLRYECMIDDLVAEMFGLSIADRTLISKTLPPRDPIAVARARLASARPIEAKAGSATVIQIQEARSSAYMQLLLRQWAKPVDRGALEVGMILMLNDDLRTAIVQEQPMQSGWPTIVQRFDLFLGRMKASDFIDAQDTGTRQLISLGTNAAPMNRFNEKDRQKAEETVRIVSQIGEARVRAQFAQVESHAELELVS